MWRVLTGVTGLASVEQHRPRCEDDGIRHEMDELPDRKAAHHAERQLEAVPDEPKEQHVGVLQVFPRLLWEMTSTATICS